MKLFGTSINKKQAERSVGCLSQLCGIRRYRLTEGKGKGMDAADVNTGSGFFYTVLFDRAMDISLATYKGINLVYHGEAKETHPAFYNGVGNDWIKGFFAGLVTTCGLQNLSGPCVDDGEPYGLHGQISYVPAEGLNDRSGWQGDEYRLELAGVMTESTLFGPKLRMERSISSLAGTPSLTITDRVTNIGQKPTPCMIMYHINPGYPLLDDRTELILSASHTEGYDTHSYNHMDGHRRFGPPRRHFEEENYLHTMAADQNGWTYCALMNESLAHGLGLYVKANVQALPYVSQWNSAAYGEYVMGIEPCNTKVANRVEQKKAGTLPYLQPGECKTMQVEIGLLDGMEAIEAFKRTVDGVMQSGGV